MSIRDAAVLVCDSPQCASEIVIDHAHEKGWRRVFIASLDNSEHASVVACPSCVERVESVLFDVTTRGLC